MRTDNQPLDDNIIEVAYRAHQRVAELVLLFQDRLDKTKESILNDQERRLEEQHHHIHELEDIARKLLEAITENKNTVEVIERLSVKIDELEGLLRSGTLTKEHGEVLKEMKIIMDSLSGVQKKKENILARIVYAALGISIFVNFLGLLIQLGVIPKPWGG